MVQLSVGKILAMAFGSAFVALALVFFLIWWSNRVPLRGGDFELVLKDKPWVLTENAKELNLLYIGYAKCPDVCPLSLSVAAEAFRKLSDSERARLQLVFVSVDFEHDTGENVATYAAGFNPSFVGLTGTQAQIDKTVDLFGASYITEKTPNTHLGYSISHSDRIFILNKKGQIVDTIPNPRSGDVVLEKIRELL